MQEANLASGESQGHISSPHLRFAQHPGIRGRGSKGAAGNRARCGQWSPWATLDQRCRCHWICLCNSTASPHDLKRPTTCKRRCCCRCADGRTCACVCAYSSLCCCVIRLLPRETSTGSCWTCETAPRLQKVSWSRWKPGPCCAHSRLHLRGRTQQDAARAGLTEALPTSRPTTQPAAFSTRRLVWHRRQIQTGTFATLMILPLCSKTLSPHSARSRAQALTRQDTSRGGWGRSTMGVQKAHRAPRFGSMSGAIRLNAPMLILVLFPGWLAALLTTQANQPIEQWPRHAASLPDVPQHLWQRV